MKISNMRIETMRWGGQPQLSGNPSGVDGDEESTDRELIISEPKVLETSDNRIYFYSEIDRESVLTLNHKIQSWQSAHVAEQKIRELIEPAPIFLHINSYGGAIFSGLAAMDQIIRTKRDVSVITYVDGCCASAATFLSIVGTKRYINRNAYMLIHQLSSVAWGKYSEIEDHKKNMDQFMKKIKGIYAEYTKVPSDKIDEILEHDLWFDAEQCLSFGLVDEII